MMNTLSNEETGAGWRLLFDGTTTKGWAPTGNADWTVTDGAVGYTTGRGVLATTDSYTNFELKVDFWAAKNANSGIFLRCTPVNGSTAFYEINIFDSHATGPTGSIIGVKPGSPVTNVHSVLPNRPNTAEKWNSYDITADGSHLVVKLNGTVTSDAVDSVLNLVSGPIQLQAGGPDGPGPAKFRNIKIRVIGK
jgi:hypothetical protein